MPTVQTNIVYGTSGETFRLPLGAPVYRDPASGIYLLASAADLSKSPAIGLVAVTSAQTRQIEVQSAGTLTVTNWAAVAGTLLLVAGSVYYLDTVAPGRLTTNSDPAGAVVRQPVGIAMNSHTLNIYGSSTVTPALTRITLADASTGQPVTIEARDGDIKVITT